MKLFSIIGIIFIYSNYAFTAEKSISKEMVQSITEILNQSPSVGAVPVGLCGNKAPDVDFLECSEAIKLEKDIRKNFNRDNVSRRLDLEKLVTACFQKRFEKCYPILKEDISADELANQFNKWKKDPRFRYPGGGAGMCHYRAQTLSYHLAQLGVKTTTIRIEHSPTLIAMDRDANDKLNGNYDDYRGYHTIVQIMVNQNGKMIPYILDPQYMTEPMPRDLYFIKTTGQVCIKSDEILDMTSCTYKERPQNEVADGHDLFNPSKSRDAALMCGWSGATVENQISLWPNPTFKNDEKIINTNGVATPDSFKNKSVSDETSKELIIYAYENYEKKLSEELKSINSALGMRVGGNVDENSQELSPFFKELEKKNEEKKKTILFSLEKIKEKIEIVKKNLNNVKD